ncbi:hypothetical protein [Clostridium kluyveri]|uniref:hypothetical protein n=1 Tax=Clostridium kluyveri TaxID=1534 RepID=UPI001FA8BC72|nr:hypothetical protein [Clostridium kluyveri]
MSSDRQLVNSIYHIGDIFEYDKDILLNDALNYLEKIKKELLNTTNNEIIEACIDVICTAFLHISHLDDFDISFLNEYLNVESSQILENIITILGSSGKIQYRNIISNYLLSDNQNIVDAAKEALETLDFMVQQKEH